MRNSQHLLQNNEVLEQISRIYLLRIITIIVESLKKEDYGEFETVLGEKDSRSLLAFAIKKIPQLDLKLLEEIKSMNQKISELNQKYAA